MDLFEVYSLYNITPVSGKGVHIVDDQGEKYLDLYGGHAVISIGHSHPHFINAIKSQLDELAFYSNSVKNPLQLQLAQKLERLSGCSDYQLFLCNSGAEANENALKLASFHTGKSRVIAFRNSFHGRTSAAVSVTDNEAICAPINKQHQVIFLELNDISGFLYAIEQTDVCAVIIEAIQGVGGLDEPTTEFYQLVASKCKQRDVVLIADEVQSGYGRSGHFFGFQHHGIVPDIISMAKGMGNGFPIGGVLIHNRFKSKVGMLGTTFGGNHLACAAGIAVLEVIEKEDLIDNAARQGEAFREKACAIEQVKRVKGRGLMLGLEFDFEIAELRKKLIYNHRIFTGSSKNKNVLRILPALNISETELDRFFTALKEELK